MFQVTNVGQNLDNVADKAANDVNTALNSLTGGYFDQWWPSLSKYAVQGGIALLGLVVGYMVAKFVARIVSNPVRKRVDETLGRFVGKMVYWAIMACVGIAVLNAVGIQATSFAAIIAAAGFAVGMAFSGTLSNFAAGIMLLVFRPFRVGDVVNAAGTTGKVNEIDLFTTTFDTPDNRRVIVPNAAIASGTIENVTHHEERRVDIAVGCDYTADLRDTRKVLEDAAESLQSNMVMGEGRGYQVFLKDLGDSSVNWVVRFWTKSENYWAVHQALTESVKDHLDNAGIGIPFPQMDIHVPEAVISMTRGRTNAA